MIKNLNLNSILILSYPIGFIYYLFTPRSNFKLNKRKKNITNYSPLLVKINYVKYWIETIWLSKEGYDSQIFHNVEIVNEDEVKKLPTVCGSLREAMENLDKDRKFLTAGEVFTDDQIDAYIDLKFQEIYKFEHTPHPIEFEMYYSQ